MQPCAVPSAAIPPATEPDAQFAGDDASALAVLALPVSAAVIVPAEKLPLLSRCTRLPAVFDDDAATQPSAVPSAAMPAASEPAGQLAGFAARAEAVVLLPALPEMFPVAVPVQLTAPALLTER